MKNKLSEPHFVNGKGIDPEPSLSVVLMKEILWIFYNGAIQSIKLVIISTSQEPVPSSKLITDAD